MPAALCTSATEIGIPNLQSNAVTSCEADYLTIAPKTILENRKQIHFLLLAPNLE